MNKITILQIGKYYHPYRGGFESSLHTLVNELKDKLQIHILASHTRCRTVIEKIKNLTIVRLANFGKIFSQPITPTVFFWMKRLNADIVHLHLPNPLAMFAYLMVSPKGKLVISYHNDIVRQKAAMAFLSPLLTRILQKADAIIVTSENLINNSSILRRFRQKCCVIPHGIDIDKFRATFQILEKAQKVKKGINKSIILFVGRLVSFKGLKYLIRAMKDIDAKLMIIGDGPQRVKLRLLARLLKVDDKILWLGGVSHDSLPVYYHACDIFVLPSCANNESFGLVILEAHASGKPVISTDLPTGVTFTNLHRKTGLVVPPRDAAALRDAIQCLLSSKELRAAYGRNGRKRVGQEFTKDKMAQKFLSLYNALKG